MKIERVDIARYTLPLTRRYRAGKVDTDRREGRLVRLTSTDGLHAYGEISPLPGLHGESLREVDSVLEVVGPGLTELTYEEFPAFAQNVANRVAACAPHGEFGAPSVVFGLQCAGGALFAARSGTTPASILSETPRGRVEVNALFVGGPAEAAEAVASGDLDPYSAVKVKVGRAPVEEERQVLEILLHGIPDRAQLRIDANRQLSLDDAVARFRGLPPERIAYLEEPLADPTELPELNARTGLMIGLDETLHDASLYYLGRAPWAAAWCLKPALVGHWHRMLFLAREAERHGASTVVSSCFETGLGLWAQAQMAAALPGTVAACGIGTEGWLRIDLVAPPFDASSGSVRTDEFQGVPSQRVLEKLTFKKAG